MKAIFFNIPAWGHVNPTLAVVRDLTARGEQVVYCNEEGFRAAIEASGAAFCPYPPQGGLQLALNAAASGEFVVLAMLVATAAERLLPFALQVIEREQPDVVLYDSMCLWGALAAHIAGLPAVGSFGLFAYPPDLKMHLFNPELLRRVVPRLPAALEFLGAMVTLRRRYGAQVPLLSNPFSSPGDLNVVYTTAAFQPGAERFDSRYRFVGPALSTRTDVLDFDLEALPRPLVYISLGSIIQNPTFYAECFRAFADFPASFVLVSKTAPTPAPLNFVVRPFAAQLEVLRHADLFITHGGMNSVHEGLYFGVPLVVVPQHEEQALVAEQVVRHGAGVKLDRLTGEALRTAVTDVLTTAAYRSAAQTLGESFRSAGGAEHAATVIQAFASQRQNKVKFHDEVEALSDVRPKI